METEMVTLVQTRGDTAGYKFQRKTVGKQVIMTTPDAMFVTIKGNSNTARILIQKPLEEMTQTEDGYWHWHTEPGDTAKLPYGCYVGDVEVHNNGGIFTISKFKFVLTEERTWSSGEQEY